MMSTQLLSSRRVFRVVWIATAISYVVCGTALAGYGLLYYFMVVFMGGAIFMVQLLGVDVHTGFFPYIGTWIMAIACLHFFSFVSMISYSIRNRSLRFPKTTGCMSALASRICHPLTRALDSALPPRSSCIGFALRSLGDVAISIWNAFDVTSSNYGIVYFLREIIQTGIQTQQAYQLSARVASPWMNHVIAFLLVVNCWAMPLIRYCLKIRSTSAIRLLCLIINFTLDFVSYIAFPIALLLPYTREYDYDTSNFKTNCLFTDVWLIQLLNEWPLVFTTSIWDGLCRLFIIFGMTRTLRSISKLLQPREPSPGPSSGAIKTTSLYPITSVVPRRLSSSFTASLNRLPPVPVLRSRTEEWGHRVLGIWGLVVLILHTLASSTSTNPQCLLQVRPWFVRRPVCSLIDINCFGNDEVTGNAAHFDASLDSIESKWLSFLVIRHCPHVEITPRIRELSWLMGVKIYNSTLVQWDENAALTQTHHPNMVITIVVCTNVSTFPQALYHDDFPTKLNTIEFSFVNLTEIPTEVANRWPMGMLLFMEGLQLPVFPDVLAKLQPSVLSLACNNFSSIPDAVFENPQLTSLSVNGNPISHLPPLHHILSTLSIVDTRIDHVDLWFDIIDAAYHVYAGSSPLCDALDQGNTSVLGLSASPENEQWQQRFNCTPVNELRYISYYPITEEDTNNPPKP